MTALYEYELLKRQIEDAENGGLRIRTGRDNAILVLLDVAKWPGAAEGVVVHRAQSLEEVLTFMQGALWCREFLRLSGALTKP